MGSVTISGSAGVIAAMRDATEEIRARVGALIAHAAQQTADDHRERMPRSGRLVRPFKDKPLADRVFVRVISDMARVVVSDAPHLHFVELGTKDRDSRPRPRKSGRRRPISYTPHSTGRMPKMGPIFVPMAVSRRIEFLEAAQALIEDREF